MALGAQIGGVLSLVLGRAGKIALAGVGCGLLGAAALARSLASLLFGVRANDPTIFAVSAGVLAAVTLLAAAIPAWRAASVDPAIVLREE
jgi:putative ABC transport system permease protein